MLVAELPRLRNGSSLPGAWLQALRDLEITLR